MPLVQPNKMRKATAVKLMLDSRSANLLRDYATWANTTRTKVMEEALKRLFEQDEEWRKIQEQKNANHDH